MQGCYGVGTLRPEASTYYVGDQYGGHSANERPHKTQEVNGYIWVHPWDGSETLLVLSLWVHHFSMQLQVYTGVLAKYVGLTNVDVRNRQLTRREIKLQTV